MQQQQGAASLQDKLEALAYRIKDGFNSKSGYDKADVLEELEKFFREENIWQVSASEAWQVTEHICSTCKHWTDEASGIDTIRDNTAAKAHFGSCKSPHFRLGYDPDNLQPDEIWIEDDEGWGCYTGPRFGCVHWVER